MVEYVKYTEIFFVVKNVEVPQYAILDSKECRAEKDESDSTILRNVTNKSLLKERKSRLKPIGSWI